ncbi:MAG: formylglycine-generating enzyme family protein [Acidobacteria bacterium]|nr:formylglycine-generating enzyme family protein [Acidobacteriota bacterium]MBI3421838.1 formylglycine-generating enzyme family protein [Acidobacteriota bacterium]
MSSTITITRALLVLTTSAGLLLIAVFSACTTRPQTKTPRSPKAATLPIAPALVNVAGTPIKAVHFEFATAKVDASGAVTKVPGQKAAGFAEDLGDNTRLEMIEIPAGEFQMGSSETEIQAAFTESKTFSPNAKLEWFNGEMPKHKVILPAFFMGKLEVTQAQWRAVAKLPQVKIELKADPANFKGDDLPVENIIWEEALEFCDRLTKLTGRTYRLPSEAEWEYAARGGTTSPFAFGETITPEIVNYDGRYPYGAAAKGLFREKTTASGSLGVANPFGLYDMHGNLWEWCQDYKHPNYNGAPTDGSAWIADGDAKLRSLRGGSWNYYGRNCRSGFRYFLPPDIRSLLVGFRVVVAAKAK